MPRLVTAEQGKQLHPRDYDIAGMKFQGVPSLPQRLLVIADISCDMQASIIIHDMYVLCDLSSNWFMYTL